MIDKILDLCLNSLSGLPSEIKELLKLKQFLKVTTIVQERESMYSLYRMRAKNLDDKGAHNVYGYREMLHNMEVVRTERVVLTFFELKELVLLVFCTEDLSFLIGTIWSPKVDPITGASVSLVP